MSDPYTLKGIPTDMIADDPAGGRRLKVDSDSGAPPSMKNTAGQTVAAGAMQFLDNIAFVDPFGQQVVSGMDTNISVNFANGLIDGRFDVKTNAVTGDGVVTAAGGYIELSSASAGTAVVESRDAVRYNNGRGFFTTFTASFLGSGIGMAGGFDGVSMNDGFPLRYDGSTDTLEFGYLRSGVFTGAVEVDHAGLGLDLSKLNIWCVIGGFLGTANPTLLVKTDVWKVAAVIQTEGVLDEPHIRLPAFPISLSAENGMRVRSGSWHGGTFGTSGRVQDRGFTYPNQPFTGIVGDNQAGTPRGNVTLSGTSIGTLFSLRAKDVFNGLPNKVKIDVVNLNVNIAPSPSSGVVQIQILGNAVISGQVFADVSPSSVVEVDDVAGSEANGQYDPLTSGGSVIGEPININYTGSGGFFGTSMGGAGSTLIDELSLDGVAGETLTVIARDLDGNDVTLNWNITWVERQI